MDRLSLLPNELLDDIFDLAHTETEPLTGPLSKRLLPFFHRSFYRDIDLPTYEQLNRLCLTSQARPDLISLIRTLRLAIPGIQSAEGETEIETKDPNSPSSNSILDLLSQLMNLKRLQLAGSSRIACLLLSPPDKRHYPFFSKLVKLHLEASFESHRDPFEFILLSNLPRYQILEVLIIDASQHTPPLVSVPEATGGIDKFRQLSPKLHAIALVGPLTASKYAEMMVRSTPAIAHLQIINTADSFPRMRELLAQIQQPHQVESLALLMPNLDLDSDAGQIPSSALTPFRLFTHLRSIQLDIDVSFEDVLNALPRPPLEHIELRDLCDVSISLLTQAVAGSTKVQTLKELVLNNFGHVRGRSVSRDLAREDLMLLRLEDLGWEFAEWTDEFSRDGFKEFLALAKEEEIEVTGDAVEALEIEDEWEAEMEYYRSVTES